MAKVILVPGAGVYVATDTKVRLIPGAGVISEAEAAVPTGKLLLINPPGLNGGLIKGGLSR